MDVPKIKILDKNFDYQNNKIYLKVEYRFNIKINKKEQTTYVEDDLNQKIKFINEKIDFLNDKLFTTKKLQNLNEHVNDEKMYKYLPKFKEGITRFNDKNINFENLLDCIFFDENLDNIKKIINEIKNDSNYDQNTFNNIQNFINSHINQMNENLSKKQVKTITEVPSYDALTYTHEINQIVTNKDIIKFLREKHTELESDFKVKQQLKKEKDQLPEEIF